MLTPASVAISSRLRPGVRREPMPEGRPASCGRTPSRRARRKRPSSVGACPSGIWSGMFTIVPGWPRPWEAVSPPRSARPVPRAPDRHAPERRGLPRAGTRRQARGMTDAEVKGAARSAPRRGTPVPARLALAAALLGFFMICLDATAVNVALPAIGRSLHGATDGLQWVLDGYTVLFAALLISAGAVSDRAGARR